MKVFVVLCETGNIGSCWVATSVYKVLTDKNMALDVVEVMNDYEERVRGYFSYSKHFYLEESEVDS